MLHTLGCECFEVENLYTRERPYKEGVPGQVSYANAMNSTTFQAAGRPVAATQLEAAWKAEGGDDCPIKIMDGLIEKLPDEHRAEIKRMLPFYLAAWLWVAFRNRVNLAGWWKAAPPMKLIEKGRDVYKIHVKSKELAKRWGLIK